MGKIETSRFLDKVYRNLRKTYLVDVVVVVYVGAITIWIFLLAKTEDSDNLRAQKCMTGENSPRRH
jgi:hypothetical protein